MDADSLKHVTLFKSLPEETRRRFAVWVNELGVAAGKHLVDEGDYAYDLFIIQEGTAEVLHDGERIAELGPGDFFGEMGVLEKAQRNATVIAKTSMRLLALSGWDVKRLQTQAPEAIEELRAAIEERRAADR